MYNDKVILWKLEFVTPIPDSMIPLGCCQKNEPVIDFTTGDMKSKFEAF